MRGSAWQPKAERKVPEGAGSRNSVKGNFCTHSQLSPDVWGYRHVRMRSCNSMGVQTCVNEILQFYSEKRQDKISVDCYDPHGFRD